MHECPGYGAALGLPAGDLGGAAACYLGDPEALEHLVGVPSGLGARAAQQFQRQHHVLPQGEFGDQGPELEHDAHRFQAPAVAGGLGEGAEWLAEQGDLTRRGGQDAGHAVQERGLTGPGHPAHQHQTDTAPQQ